MPDRRLILLLVLWFLALLPMAGTFLTHYPDERHYTDAALWMLETGDYFTPLAADGQPRFLKPIVPYWTVAAPYLAFGINVFTSRLGFLLAGVLTIGLIYRSASEMFNDRKQGLTAALIAASHVQLMFASTRSIPDVLLVLFLTMSSLGFIRLILLKVPGRGAYWLAWGGVGLAMASKGLLALVFVLYVLGFAWIWLRPKLSLRALVNIPAIIGGSLLGTGWYLLMLMMHGQQFWQVFWSDQVEEKISSAWYEPLTRIPIMGLIVLVNFMPWSIVAIETWVRRREASEPEQGGTSPLPMLGSFVFGWIVLCCIVFGLGGNPSLRYVLPVLPMLAIWLAQWIHMHPLTTRRPLIGWAGVMAVGLMATGMILGLLNLQLGHWVAGVSVIALGLLMGWALLQELRRGMWSPMALLGVGMVLLFPLVFMGASRVFLPDSATSLSKAVQAQQARWGDKPLVFIGNPAVASKMRVVSGGRLRLGQLASPPEQGLRNDVVYLLQPQHVLAVDPAQFQVQRIAAGYVNLPPGEFAHAVFTWRFKDFLEKHRQYFILAEPKPLTLVPMRPAPMLRPNPPLQAR